MCKLIILYQLIATALVIHKVTKYSLDLDRYRGCRNGCSCMCVSSRETGIS